ncbi:MULTISPECIES: ferredoxin-type protein NapF [Tenebrionibacter/Tenebrionicola group]|jgi:ferredoxin-type protein NapF|uniref:Ferredoxin-type protein NapF n=2 Tax=Tenebrionibacter/Tenebrionicola group TaxID=2969848 RepID=A0A8K0XZE2_9ENTR|nr:MULTISPECIES: ferredoxin-type protein NapF [Tenebrionibacter/Tenebrionicola group]MBK4715504.1 ferredoxin-type protein NapF [Tenebrionibacter intestinalis]MBV5094963.1 ferredoxin-type protein NapF [Tenebrionicola larvae]
MAECSRRSLLTGAFRGQSGAMRPPWSRADVAFTAVCTRCDACVQACETGIVIRGAGGFPVVDFHRGECTFCYACAESCAEALFVARDSLPWRYQAAVGAHCLAENRIECRSCEDACPERAIRFRPTRAGVARPQIVPERCSACGACAAGCPVFAIEFKEL